MIDNTRRSYQKKYRMWICDIRKRYGELEASRNTFRSELWSISSV